MAETVRAASSTIAPDAVIAPDASIVADEVVIGAGAQIGAGVRIEAQRVHIGAGAVIERGTTVRGLGGPMLRFALGDQTLIGFASQILCPEFAMGDYGQLHNTALASGYKPLRIGHNCWIGQNTILNCTEVLTLGNNVRVGTGSQLWTHVASGELLEGCTLFGENPLTLEDNVWIVGGAVISPGLLLQRNSIVMTGSVLTRSTEAFHTYAGVPAKDVTDKLSFWKDLGAEEKWAMLTGYVDEFNAEQGGKLEPLRAAASLSELGTLPSGAVAIVREAGENDWMAAAEAGVSLFDLASKEYLKQRSPAEVAWMRWITGYRARFLPRER